MAVDKSKFRTCDNTAFCKRNRQPAPHNYYIHSNTVAVQSNTIYSANVYNGVWLKRDPLQLLVRIINHGTAVSVQLNDIYNTDTINRYYITDIIKSDVWNTNIDNIEWIHSDTSSIATYSVFGHKYRINIQYQPFLITFIVNNNVVQVINGQQKLVYEQQHTALPKPTVDVNSTDEIPAMDPTIDKYDYDGDNYWIETFGTHTDYKQYGTAAIGIDVTYSNTEHIYGLAEHASTYVLKNTDGSTDDAYSEPYRLWNLDVFEYDLDVPMSLYGAIPFIVAHNKHSTTGCIWLNAAETYVDISQDTTTQSKQSYWSSESGAFDMYVLLGPTPDILYRTYGQLTGYTAMPQYFALGYHQCRWNYKSQDDALSVDSNFDTHNIPYDVLWLDIEHTDGKRYFTWDTSNFPDPVAMQTVLKNKGRKLVTIVDPHIKRDTNYYVHSEATANKYYVKQCAKKSADLNDYEGKYTSINKLLTRCL